MKNKHAAPPENQAALLVIATHSSSPRILLSADQCPTETQDPSFFDYPEDLEVSHTPQTELRIRRVPRRPSRILRQHHWKQTVPPEDIRFNADLLCFYAGQHNYAGKDDVVITDTTMMIRLTMDFSGWVLNDDSGTAEPSRSTVL
jgi:hypothetical protein